MSDRLTKKTGRESAFTLIEVLAALAIASVIVMLTAALLWNVGLFFDRGTRGVSQADRLVMAVNRLAVDFASTRFAQRITKAGDIVTAFDGDPGNAGRSARVVFVSGGNVSTGRPGEEVVVLTVERSDNITRLVRRRAPWLGQRTAFEEIVPTDPVVLIEGNVDIRFSFGKVTAEGALSWQENWSKDFSLPRFVRLIVRSRETGLDLLAGTEFIIRSNSPPSCVQENASAKCLLAATTAPGGAGQVTADKNEGQ
jgi:prepilin-type N-terminal cleavage/methylation domain-containing protein